MSSGTTSTSPGGDIVVYEDPDGQAQVDVRLERETVWLTQKQMADLFGRERSVVARHIGNAFDEGELDPMATRANFAQVRSEGARTVSRNVAHYNLDVIISVGYRVKSLRGTQFRQWATRTLARTLQNQALVDDTGQTVLDLVTLYADTWRLLLEYDEDRLPSPRGVRPSTGVLSHDHAGKAIAEFRNQLAARGEATALFGNPRGHGLEAVLGAIEQTMFGESLYRSQEEKAANLLYLIVKSRTTRSATATSASARCCFCCS